MTKKSAISRVPRWAAALAIAAGMGDPSRPKRTAPTRDVGISAEAEIEIEDEQILAEMNAEGRLHQNVEDSAGDRELKHWEDAENATMIDHGRVAYLATRQTVGEGQERALVAQEKQAALMERSLFEIQLGRRASPEMTQLAQLARQLRGQL